MYWKWSTVSGVQMERVSPEAHSVVDIIYALYDAVHYDMA